MALYLDDIRKEFAKHLTENSSTRFSMDKALAYVVELAYLKGMEDGAKAVEDKRNRNKDD